MLNLSSDTLLASSPRSHCSLFFNSSTPKLAALLITSAILSPLDFNYSHALFLMFLYDTHKINIESMFEKRLILFKYSNMLMVEFYLSIKLVKISIPICLIQKMFRLGANYHLYLALAPLKIRKPNIAPVRQSTAGRM